MINPNKIHRSRAVIESIGAVEVKLRLPSGALILSWTDRLPKGSTVGQAVNIQASYSIMLESYVAKTIRKLRVKR